MGKGGHAVNRKQRREALLRENARQEITHLEAMARRSNPQAPRLVALESVHEFCKACALESYLRFLEEKRK
jgi:hypothetical protein